MPNFTDSQLKLAKMVLASKDTIALTGAGLSVPSGIPDFRSPGTGRWTKVNPQKVAHISVFNEDPETFWDYYKERLDLVGYDPNPAHYALADLQAMGLLGAVVTQNIDGLQQKAGVENVIELHGSVRTLSCKNGHQVSRDDAVAHLFADNGVPYCPVCDDTPMKPDVILFGEMLPPTLEQAYALADKCELIICIGTSLEVRPAADLPLMCIHDGRPVAIIARDSKMDAKASVRLTDDIAIELPALVAAIKHLQEKA